MDAMAAPMKKGIGSPGKTRAGYLLNRRKAPKDPKRGEAMYSPLYEPSKHATATKVTVMMMPMSAPTPFDPSSMFVALAALVMPRGTASTVMIPRLIPNKYTSPVPYETTPNGSASRKGRIAFAAV